MRVRLLACIALAFILICSASAASASLVTLTYPAGDLTKQLPDIKPVYSPQSGDISNIMNFIGEVVGITNDRFMHNSVNDTAYGMNTGLDLATPLSSLPDPMTFLTALTPGGISDPTAKANINRTLIGMNLTYSNFAGRPMNYTITKDSIKSIDKDIYKGQPAWKVRVGDSMAWDLTMDASGTKILDTTQLFYT